MERCEKAAKVVSAEKPRIGSGTQRNRVSKDMRVHTECSPDVASPVGQKRIVVAGSVRKEKSKYAQQIIQISKERTRSRRHLLSRF